MRKEEEYSAVAGLRIGRPRLAVSGKPSASEAVFGFLLTGLGIFGTAWAFISSFSLPLLPLTFFSYLFLFLLAFSAAFSFRKAGRVLLPLYALIYGFLLWRDWPAVEQGFFVAADGVLGVYSDRLNYVMQTFAVKAPASEKAWLCTLFLLFCLFLLCGLLAWAVFRHQGFWNVFFLTVPFLLPGLFLMITPDFTAMLMLFLCWTALGFIRLQSKGRGRDFVPCRGRVYRAGSGSSAARTGLLLLPCAALCLAAVLAAFPQSRYVRPGFADSLRTDLSDSFTQEAFFGGSRSLAGNTVRVDLRNANGVRFTGKTMLQVKADVWHSMYLKSFAAGLYTGSGWQLYPDSDYEEINRKLDGLNAQNMLHTFETLLGQQNEQALNPYYLQVKNVAAARQCIYAPYNLITSPSDITGVRFVNDSFIRSGSLFGTSSYSLYAYGISPDAVHTTPESVPLSFLMNKGGEESGGEGFQSDLREYLLGRPDYGLPLTTENIARYYKEQLPDNLLKRIDDLNQLAFLQKEQDYRSFMYDKYTQLPEATREKILELLAKDSALNSYIQGDGSASYGTFRLKALIRYASPYQVVDAVRQYLDGGNFTYTLSPKAAPKGEDFALWFLTQGKSGYCVHFATAAVVMLRALGIPARYAEGYVVTADDAKTADGSGWVSVPDSRAHSWVEIYCPGTGWQPVEVTPGYDLEKNLTQANDSQSQAAVSSAVPSQAPASSAPPVSSAPASSSAGQAESSSPEDTAAETDRNFAAGPVLILFLAALGGSAVLAARRKILLALREKRFRQKDAREAVLCVYAYLKKLEPFGAEISAEAERTALKARFSRSAVTEEERNAVSAYAAQLAKEIYGRVPWTARLAFKYLFGLI